MLAVVFAFSSCEKDLMKDINDGDWNNERNIIDLGLQQQIGLPEIERTGDEATVNVIVNANGLDLKAIDVTGMVLSYDATADVSAGDKLNFDNAEKKATINVTSKKGESLEWDIFVEPFVNDLEGTWTIGSYYIKWDDGNGWGNSGEGELSSLLAESARGLDDIITFGPVEGANDNGLVYGSYERSKGADGLLASFVYARTGEDWGSRYDQIPVGAGQWILNKDNTVTIVVDGKSYTTQMFERVDETTLKLPLNPGEKDPGRINWDDYYGDHTSKFCVTTELYYRLTKQ